MPKTGKTEYTFTAQLDEAMGAATSGELASLETFADICCTLMLACERAGDAERPQQWTVLEDFVRKYHHVVRLAFCRTCCADVFAANGCVDAAGARSGRLGRCVRILTRRGQSVMTTLPRTCPVWLRACASAASSAGNVSATAI
jgi:hypothetical protein